MFVIVTVVGGYYGNGVVLVFVLVLGLVLVFLLCSFYLSFTLFYYFSY